MEEKKAVTGIEAGLSEEEQIKTFLQMMIDHGGQASQEEIYKNLGDEINRCLLSENNKLLIYDDKKQVWRITPKGRDYIEESRESDRVEEEEILSDNTDDSSISDPYDPSQIDVDITHFTVFHIMRKIELGEINLQPDFQRHLVWDETRQSRLIESILIRIPLPAFYLDAVDDDNWLVIDGLQRLSTLDKFYNKNELQLKNLEFLTELEGKTFEELPRKFQRRIEDTKLNIYTIQPGTPSRVKFTIFYRINTGGLVLTAQEIRHALFQGKSTVLLKKLASSEEFKEATTNSIRSRRMEDRESVLRFLAFHMNSYKKYKNPDFHDFLSTSMEQINNLSTQEIRELEESFLAAMRKAKAIFGRYAFRRMYARDGKRYPISKPIFEIWTTPLVDYPLESLIKYKDDITEEWIKIMNKDDYFNKSITQGTSSVKKVHKRFCTIEELLARVVK
jgi:hypothetical protein